MHSSCLSNARRTSSRPISHSQIRSGMAARADECAFLSQVQRMVADIERSVENATPEHLQEMERRIDWALRHTVAALTADEDADGLVSVLQRLRLAIRREIDAVEESAAFSVCAGTIWEMRREELHIDVDLCRVLWTKGSAIIKYLG